LDPGGAAQLKRGEGENGKELYLPVQLLTYTAVGNNKVIFVSHKDTIQGDIDPLRAGGVEGKEPIERVVGDDLACGQCCSMVDAACGGGGGGRRRNVGPWHAE
jgi:hypothetical protein